MKTTVNQLNRELRAIAQSHEQINSFEWKDFARAINESSVTYPLMNAYIDASSGQMSYNITPLNLVIIFSDKVYKSLRNIDDTESDLFQLARDVFNVMNRSPRWQSIGKILSVTIDKFGSAAGMKGADEVAAVGMRMQFKLFDTASTCDLPMDGYDFESSNYPACEPVLIYENGVLVATIQSGGTYSYESGGEVLITNSNESYEATAEAGETFVLPDTTMNISVNGVLQETIIFPTLSDQEINITN